MPKLDLHQDQKKLFQTINLYPHQMEVFDKIREEMGKHQAILLVAACGFGKTILMGFMASRVKDKNKRLFFTVHRKDLITQSIKTLDKFKLNYGVISASYMPQIKQPIQVASIASLKSRMSRYPAPDLLVVDEAHHCKAKGWGEIVSHYKKAGSYIIGLTATPDPLLSKHFDVIVEGKSVSWLIDNKFLSEYRLFIPSTPDVNKLHVRMGDYVQKENEELMDKPKITGDAILHWRKYANEKRTIAFCCSIAHSKHITESFKASGIAAAHLDGDTVMEDRIKIIKDFADGKIKVITNCGIFCEGFDLSAQVGRDITVEAVILLRPTMSLALYIQQVMRALRYKDYPAIILDHANCAMTHGLPDEEREWTLEQGPLKSKKVPTGAGIKICEKCFAAMLPFKTKCAYCGYEFEVNERQVEHAEGDLVEVDPSVIRKLRLKEEWKCKTKEDLIALGKSRGYSWPEQWAQHRWNYREQRKLEAMEKI